MLTMVLIRKTARFLDRAVRSFGRDPIGFICRLPTNARRLINNPALVDLMIDSDAIEYPVWIKSNELSGNEALRHYSQLIENLEAPPLISILMPVYNSDLELLDAAVRSVTEQFYPHWELCIVDDASPDKDINEYLVSLETRSDRIKILRREENGHICRATNDAFSLSTGGWIGLLDHDDLLAPNALAEMAKVIATDHNARVIYSDEDKIDAEGGKRFAPHFKPEYSPELLRSQNYINHFSLFKRDLVVKAGGWRVGFEGSQDHDLLLRAIEYCGPKGVRHVPKILYHWRAMEGSTAASIENKDYAVDAGLRAVQDHLKRTGMNAIAEQAPGLPFYRVRPHLDAPAPLASIIIPTRDHLALLRNCVEGILHRTDYPNLEVIIIDNISREPETLDYLLSIGKDERVWVVRDESQFNYSALNNKASKIAKGEVIILLNNDIEIIDDNWLGEMVAWAIQPGVGCVGAKLLYPDNLVQHAGVVLGIGGVAGHSHKRFNRTDNGYFGRLQLIQNYSAVTGACLAVKKSIFEEVGGLDEENLAVAFNDVDFCLKLGQTGYRVVWTPYAELYHLESTSRGSEDTREKQARFMAEANYMKAKWGDLLTKDPFYSPNLTLAREDFSLGDRP